MEQAKVIEEAESIQAKIDELATGLSSLAIIKQNSLNIVSNDESLCKKIDEMSSHISSATVKHKLQDKWSFWFYKCDMSRDWKDNLLHITDVTTIEDFWAVQHKIKPVESLSDGCDYIVFKHGIKPMWEDPKNANGGRIILNIDKKNVLSFLSKIWLNSILFLIGSSYDDEESDNINGLVVNVRSKLNRISLWTCDFDNKSLQEKIAKRFMKYLGLQENEKNLEYEKHENESDKRKKYLNIH
jgi:translation initiation factor 4E